VTTTLWKKLYREPSCALLLPYCCHSVFFWWASIKKYADLQLNYPMRP
jgi:hypothetical protein